MSGGKQSETARCTASEGVFSTSSNLSNITETFASSWWVIHPISLSSLTASVVHSLQTPIQNYTWQKQYTKEVFAYLGWNCVAQGLGFRVWGLVLAQIVIPGKRKQNHTAQLQLHLSL